MWYELKMGDKLNGNPIEIVLLKIRATTDRHFINPEGNARIPMEIQFNTC